MKLTLITPALVAIFGLALAGTSVNAQTSTNAPAATTTKATAPAVKKTPYKGKITAIDTAANTVTIQGAKEPMTLTITSATKYKGGAALSDFAVGDNVTGSYTKDAAGTMTAASLHKKVATK